MKERTNTALPDILFDQYSDVSHHTWFYSNVTKNQTVMVKKTESPKRVGNKRILPILFLLFGLLYMAYESFDDFVKRNPDGTYELKDKRKDKLNDKVRRMRESAETYRLVARRNGYYQCLHCPNGTFYLYKGEIAKIGVTIQGEANRYKPQYLRRMNLEYITIYKGSVQKAKELEVVEIGKYPLSEENISRPDKPQGELLRYKLARPILNLGDQWVYL